MANISTKKTTKKGKTKTGKQGRPGGNPDLEKYKWKAKVPGRPNDGHLTLRIPSDTLSGVKQLPNWQDKVRAKLEELLEEESAIATSTETYPATDRSF